MYIFVVTKVLIFVEIGYGKSKMIQCFLNRKYSNDISIIIKSFINIKMY